MNASRIIVIALLATAALLPAAGVATAEDNKELLVYVGHANSGATALCYRLNMATGQLTEVGATRIRIRRFRHSSNGRISTRSAK
jgi:hypothetical protein